MTLTRYRRGAGRLPFRWQTVFSREVGGRSAGCELLHRTFFCPGIDRCSALEFYTLRATDRARTERELVERGGGARKERKRKGRVDGEGSSKTHFNRASLDLVKKFPIDIHFLALDRFCVRSFLYCLQNAH